MAMRRRVSEHLQIMTVDYYTRLEMIGSGSFSKVWLACKNGSIDTERYVVKDVSLEEMSEQDRDASIYEVILHSKLDHVNIIKYYEVVRTNPNLLSIVLEHAAGGDLAAFLHRRRSMGRRIVEREALVWFSQVLCAVEYLHRNGVVHRDIKAANIFLSGEGVPKLGDFNLSKILDCNAKRMCERTCCTPCGTPMYNSPEQWLRMPYTQQVDIWAMGCLLFEMLLSQPTFLADSMEALHRNIHNGVFDRLALSSVSSGSRDMILCMLTHEPRRRPTAKELMKYPPMLDVKGFLFRPPEFGGQGLAYTGIPSRRSTTTITSILEEDTAAPTYGSHQQQLPSLADGPGRRDRDARDTVQRRTLSVDSITPLPALPRPRRATATPTFPPIAPVAKVSNSRSFHPPIIPSYHN